MREPLEPVVTAVATTPYSVNISWRVTSIVHDAEIYTVYYGTDNMTLVNSTEIPGSANVSDMYTVTISGLMPFTTYYYVVSAENSEGTTNTSVMNFRTNETGMTMANDTVHNIINLFCFLLYMLSSRHSPTEFQLY